MDRCVALFLGGFGLLNLISTWLRPAYDGNLIWIDLRRLPSPLGTALLTAGVVFLVLHALRPATKGLRRWSTVVVTGLLTLAAASNATVFWLLLSRGEIRAATPIPVSLGIVLLFLPVLIAVLRGKPCRPRSRWALVPVLPVLAVLFPLAQMVSFGGTDYRRPADAIVVFGARTYADGKPSLALADRVRTGCALYHEGLAPRLVFSGGPGDGEIHETDAMRDLALSLGVPEVAIRLDPEGVNTRATVENTARMMEEEGWSRLLAVSHGYHLPRIKMTYGRVGRRVFTVPAVETRRIGKMPVLMGREVAAWWVYWVRDGW